MSTTPTESERTPLFVNTCGDGNRPEPPLTLIVPTSVSPPTFGATMDDSPRMLLFATIAFASQRIWPDTVGTPGIEKRPSPLVDPWTPPQTTVAPTIG